MSKGCGCPYCANQKVCTENSLATCFPELIPEWHPTKNRNKTPYNTIAKSNKKVWWLCEKGHEWTAVIHSRANGTKCPYCANQKVCTENSLATCFPELIPEWHPTKNRNKTPYNTIAKSNKKVWWLCEKGHE